ncbi:MAG: hypothetical protein SCH68_11340 [Brevefilum sp.]|nr:hypothetical protein [Brevefilum sp.]
MKKLMPLLALFTAFILLSGCKNSTNFTPDAEPDSPQENVSCNEISFYLDPSLGNGYGCVTIPESNSLDRPSYYPFIYPTHTEVTIQEYPLIQTQFPPQVWIYPVSRFSEQLPEVIPLLVNDLQSIISDGTHSGKKLPFLPAILEQQTFFAHEKNLTFNGGQGIRYITEYSEGPNPITNKNIIYTFQGLTDDGKYWIAVTLPVSHPILPDEYTTLPEGYTQESLILDYTSYTKDMKDRLSNELPDSFSPSLSILDILIMSITIRQ